jgi:PAS domain S-box-containing protein
MEEELIKSEERFYKAFNNNPNPFAITRARDYKVVDINEAFLKLLEFKREEVIGNYLQNLTIFPGERRQALTSDLLKLEKIEIPETEIRTKSGKILFASVYSQVIDLEGERHILTNLIDITERKKSEEALRINKERFRALTMASSQTIYRMSPDWKIMYSTTGGDTFKPASVETSNWLKEYVPKEEHEKVFSAVNKAVESKTMFELEHKVIRFDGSVGWTYSRAIPLINEKGEITEWFGAANEITVQKESEEALKKSEERFKKAFESNPNPATITRTSDFKIIGVNAAFLHLFEFTRDEVIGNTYIDLDLYPQSTRDKLLSTFLKNKIIKSTQVDVKTNSGKILNMLVSGEIIHFGNEDHMLVNFVDITHQKQAEEALKISEERFSKAFLNGPFGAIMAHIPDYRCVEVNSTFLELFDFKREEVIGHTSLELNIFQEKDRSEIISLIERGGSVHYRELDMQTKTGQTINVLFSVQKLLIGNEFYIFSSYVDITARKRAEEDLYQSEQRWITTLSSLNEAVIATDQQGKVTFLNLEAECLMGWAKNEVMNLPVHDFYYTIHEDTKEPLDNPVHKILAEGKSYHEKNHKLLVRKQGEQIPIEESGAPIRDWNGNPTGTVLIFHDISEQKLYDKKMKEYSSMLEERVKERTYELELAKEQAESADRLKTSFLLTMSHELRTPLNSIIGFSGILHKEFAGPLNEEQKKQINMISSSGRHLLHLVNDILDMSKLEVGQLVVQIAPFEVEKVIDHVLEIEKPFAEDKGIEIKVIKPDEMIIAESDAARFQQVILNLVHNALKFTDEGFVSIEYGSDKDKIWIRVADTGIGIKEEKISRLFVSFAQIQDDDLIRRHQGTGSGLGLAISKKIMELLHGSITVQSKYGEGSIFTVTLAQEKEVKRRA